MGRLQVSTVSFNMSPIPTWPPGGSSGYNATQGRTYNREGFNCCLALSCCDEFIREFMYASVCRQKRCTVKMDSFQHLLRLLHCFGKQVRSGCTDSLCHA